VRSLAEQDRMGPFKIPNRGGAITDNRPNLSMAASRPRMDFKQITFPRQHRPPFSLSISGRIYASSSLLLFKPSHQY